MQKTLDHLDFIAEHIYRTEKYLDKKEIDSIQFCCIGLLSRLRLCSTGLRSLLSNINSNPSLEFSCGIVLRSSILDSLIALNIYRLLLEAEKSQGTTEEKRSIVKEFCDEILSDGLKQTVKYVRTAYEMNIIDQQKMTDTFVNFTKSHQRFFHTYPGDGSLPIVKINKNHGPIDLFKTLANTPELQSLSKIYDTYQFFSKYDHFGILYFDVINYTYIEQLERISSAVEILVGTLSFLHLALRMYNEDDFLIKQSNVAAEYLYNKIVNPPKEKSGETIY